MTKKTLSLCLSLILPLKDSFNCLHTYLHAGTHTHPHSHSYIPRHLYWQNSKYESVNVDVYKKARDEGCMAGYSERWMDVCLCGISKKEKKKNICQPLKSSFVGMFAICLPTKPRQRRKDKQQKTDTFGVSVIIGKLRKNVTMFCHCKWV